MLALYDEEQHRHLADLMNIDPKTCCRHLRSPWEPGCWAIRIVPCSCSDANDAHARRRGHPFDLGLALTVGGMVWDYRREPEQMLARVEEAERLGRAHSLPFISDVLAQIYEGNCLAAGRAPRRGHSTAAGCTGNV